MDCGSVAPNRPICLPLIQVQVEPQTPTLTTSLALTEELRRLMLEVEELREETKSIICNCTDPNCPFLAAVPSASDIVSTDDESVDDDIPHEDDSDEEDRSPDLGFGSMERIFKGNISENIRFSLPYMDLMKVHSPPMMSLAASRINSNPMSLSLTNIPRGVQKRADGTIVENDYPGFYCSNRKSKKKKRLTGISSMSGLNHLGVMSTEVPPMADCQVDQDGTITTGKDYTFSRQAPERKNVRSPRSGVKKISLEHVNSNPIISRRESGGTSSSDLMRHSSVPSIEKKSIDRMRTKFQQIRHSIAM